LRPVFADSELNPYDVKKFPNNRYGRTQNNDASLLKRAKEGTVSPIAPIHRFLQTKTEFRDPAPSPMLKSP
jgi:hypothetical protein